MALSLRIASLVSYCLLTHPGVSLFAQEKPVLPTSSDKRMLVNPLLPSGPDPWVISRDGFYYYMHTTGKNLTIWKTKDIAQLATAEKKVVWTPPSGQAYSKDIWAPELHYLQGRWYIYFAADERNNLSHRLWVLENASPDPLQGNWELKGKLADDGDHWAIDGTILENRGKLYAIWSGWAGEANGTQSIYISRMKNPWTLERKRTMISTPDYSWEKIGDRPKNAKETGEENPGDKSHEPWHIEVNEGPEVLKHSNQIFLIYSASACWTDYYSLGMLQASDSSDLLKVSSWKKSDQPVFWRSASAHAFGPGHNSFFKSPDGKQDWILYHANLESGQGCGGKRNPRAQPFTWNANGTPNFGRPVETGKPIPAP